MKFNLKNKNNTNTINNGNMAYGITYEKTLDPES